MTARESDANDLPVEARGSVSAGPATWTWEARRSPDDDDRHPSPFLDWWEVHFRREDDPEQEARVRAGIPDHAEWTEELVTSVLDSSRRRTWRDADGELWTVELKGWLATGISTEVAEADQERRVVFRRREGGERVERMEPELSSLTVEADRALQELLEASRGDG